MTAFRNYQLNEAWTWELQALTRARFIAGSSHLGSEFTRVRQEVLCRQRDEKELAAELLEMRRKMVREREPDSPQGRLSSSKHRRGGLIDIEFIAQLGVLASARQFPRVLQVTGTLSQLNELKSIGWLSSEDARVLEKTFSALSQHRLMGSLARTDADEAEDTLSSAEIFERKLGESSRSVP
jgi:glutamate-ammonia-ligase adenylyltransferase